VLPFDVVILLRISHTLIIRFLAIAVTLVFAGCKSIKVNEPCPPPPPPAKGGIPSALFTPTKHSATGVEVSRMVFAAAFQWPDAIDVADLNGDGKLDLVSGGGHPGIVYTVRIFFQGESIGDWRERIIYEGDGRIQGVAVFKDARTKRQVIMSADQLNGKIRLHAATGQQWSIVKNSVVVSERPWIQSIVALDLDGDGVDEIVYAWEGTSANSGGVNALWLASGSDPAQPASWQDTPLVTLEGAWAIREPILLDLDGDGRASELLISARRASDGTRNPASKPGLYYLNVNRIGTISALTKIGEAGRDPINFARGSFFGRGSPNDVAIVDLVSDTITFLETEGGRCTFELRFPLLPGTPAGLSSGGWNVATIADRIMGRTRDALIAVSARSDGRPSGLWGIYWDGAAWQFKLLEVWQHGHPVDNRLIWIDLDGDGVLELIAPDSGGNRLLIYNFRTL
jgi:hypothetical protein